MPGRWPHLVVHAAGLLPLAWMISDFLLRLEDYSANRTLMLRSGSMGLLLLVASFACTPMGWLLRWPRAAQIRRALGLYGFLFVAIHLLVYAWLDNGWMFDLILRDLGERRAMSVGLLAFVLLIPLAATSTNSWQRRLVKHWRMLHRLVYLALPLSVLHYLWLERDFHRAAWVYTSIVALLLLLRLNIVRRRLRPGRG
jgi:sulfoxide reductase heme-binding subunit YedZ